jgi:hypothetical protein
MIIELFLKEKQPKQLLINAGAKEKDNILDLSYHTLSVLLEA